MKQKLKKQRKLWRTQKEREVLPLSIGGGKRLWPFDALGEKTVSKNCCKFLKIVQTFRKLSENEGKSYLANKIV